MSNQSRQKRMNNELRADVQKNTTKIHGVENEVKKLRKDYDAHTLRHILDDIAMERFSGSGKPMYTYQEIADRWDTSASTVNRIADEYGLSRRKENKAL